MTEKIDIVTTIATSGQPITLTGIAKVLNTQAAAIGAQIKRLKKEELLDETEPDHYVLSDKGIEWLDKEKAKATKLLKAEAPKIGFNNNTPADPEPDPEPDPDESLPPGSNTVGGPTVLDPKEIPASIMSENAAGLTDYNFFFQTGLQIGIDRPLCALICMHVWNGGQYDDLDWVRKAFGEMQVRGDLASRWWNVWRSHLNKNVDPSLITKVRKEGNTTDGKIEADSGQSNSLAARNMDDFKKLMTHSIIDDSPKFMGEGEGDMTYEDAKKLCEIRAASKAKAGAMASPSAAPTNPMTDALSILERIIPLLKPDGSGQPKSFMVTPSDEGGPPTIEEIEPGKPIVAPSARVQQSPAKIFVVDQQDGAMEEIDPSKPYVKIVHINDKKRDDDGNNGRRPIMFFNPNTQMIEEWDPSKGPIMVNKPAVAENNQPLIQMTGSDGKPVNLSLSTYFALEEHKEKMQEKRESHQMKQGLAKEFKGLMSRATRAFAHMSNEQIEEEEPEELPPPTAGPETTQQ